jgi:hypothetical protein
VPDSDVEIRGLERHLELRELQRRKEEERALREAEVFGLNANFVAGQKPEPFELMTQLRHIQNAQKFQDRIDRLKLEQLKDCTFRPQISAYDSGKFGVTETGGFSQYDMAVENAGDLLNY